MDILSFSLGIAFVVVAAIAAVAVYAFVKVTRLERDVNTLFNLNSDSISNVYRQMETLDRELNAKIDSRFDKLQSKQLLKS